MTSTTRRKHFDVQKTSSSIGQIVVYVTLVSESKAKCADSDKIITYLNNRKYFTLYLLDLSPHSLLLLPRTISTSADPSFCKDRALACHNPL